jgi:hypothetical protein
MRVLKLEEVKVTAKEAAALKEAMANAPKLNAALKNEDLFDLETIRKALKVELEGNKRPTTIGRLLGRFKTLVNRDIDMEVFGG